MIVGDLMLKSNKLAANIFTKISHYRNINLVYFTENVFDKTRITCDKPKCTLLGFIQKSP